MNPIEMAKMLRGARNPQQMFGQMLQNNPQVQQTLTQIMNSSGNMSPQQIAMQLAKQKGVPQNEVERLYADLCGGNNTNGNGGVNGTVIK